MWGITAKSEMKPGARPKFCKARPVPYALQEAVEAEYNHLESERIVERLEFSEWDIPMVDVPKEDGTTRYSGDYAVTVNPSLKSLSIIFPSGTMSSSNCVVDNVSLSSTKLRTDVFTATKSYNSVLRPHPLCSSALWTSSLRV